MTTQTEMSDNQRRPMEIVGFEVKVPFIPFNAVSSRATGEAKLTVTVNDYSDMTLEAEIYLPPEVREKIRAILQDHLDNRGKRS